MGWTSPAGTPGLVADLEHLASLEGELWARRIRDQLVRWDGSLQMDWPGREEEARMLAGTLSKTPRARDRLAKIIQERAANVWRALNDDGSP